MADEMNVGNSNRPVTFLTNDLQKEKGTEPSGTCFTVLCSLVKHLFSGFFLYSFGNKR